jgi:hypothetical protein
MPAPHLLAHAHASAPGGTPSSVISAAASHAGIASTEPEPVAVRYRHLWPLPFLLGLPAMNPNPLVDFSEVGNLERSQLRAMEGERAAGAAQQGFDRLGGRRRLVCPASLWRWAIAAARWPIVEAFGARMGEIGLRGVSGGDLLGLGVDQVVSIPVVVSAPGRSESRTTKVFQKKTTSVPGWSID